MMMKEISLHALDIIQNSIAANATLIEINLHVDHVQDRMVLSISDNGCGMTETFQREVLDPFVTSRTTRKVGLGIPMFQAGAEAAGGTFSLESTVGVGTRIEASYQISHWDRPPLGNIAETLYTSILCNEGLDFAFTYTVDDKNFRADTREIKAVLGDVPLHTPEVSAWLKEYLYEGIEALNGGV